MLHRITPLLALAFVASHPTSLEAQASDPKVASEWPLGEPIYFNDFEGDGPWGAEQNGIYLTGRRPDPDRVNRGCRREIKTTPDAYSGSRSYSLTHLGVWLESGANCEQYWRQDGDTSPFEGVDGVPIAGGYTVEFAWRIPDNYRLLSEPNDWSNQKLIAMFQCTYHGCMREDGKRASEWKIVQEFTPFTGNPSGGLSRPLADSVSTIPRSASAVNLNNTIRDALRGPMISLDGPARPGEWSKIRFCVQPSSARGELDGFYRTWVDGVIVLEYRGSVWGRTEDTPPYVTGGYFMGAANAYVSGEVEFMVDDFAIYVDSSLCEGEYSEPMMSFPRKPVTEPVDDYWRRMIRAGS